MGYRNFIITRNHKLINYNYNLSDFTHILLKQNKFDKITKGFDLEANLSD